jgi:SAM-dependent methyltransferase
MAAATLDPISYLRTEWISAALCTNQTPRTADVCLQLGTEDGRAVTFVPRTIRDFWTSSPDATGELNISVQRQLKQAAERRGTGVNVQYMDQRADDLKLVANDSVDVVLSLQAAAKMKENGLDWKKSIREAARVLKPGGRLLFVEQTEIDGESYIEYAQGLMSITSGDDDLPVKEDERFPIFEEGDADPVPMCPIPHIAGVAVKSENAGLTMEQRKARDAQLEKERLAELSIRFYEQGGIKKRKKKKKQATAGEKTVSTPTSK